MGWKGYEESRPIGMLFRKTYCIKCGARLKTRKISNIYKKGESGYQNHILGHGTIGMDRIEIATYIYKCLDCGCEMSYDNQVRYSRIQKKLKKRVLSDDEKKMVM